MKVVFLDFDGVLNSQDWFYRRLPTCEFETREIWERNAFDPEAIERLNRLLETTKAKVVVSSSWRICRPLEKLRAILGYHNFKGEIIDTTPDLHRSDEARYFPETEPVQRGEEIWSWLQRHPEVEAYVILDDSGDMEPVMDKLIRTSWGLGLQDEHVDRAIRLLDH